MVLRFWLVTLYIVSLSCSDTGLVNIENELSNLEVDIIIDEVENGLVLIDARAMNADYYEFFPGDVSIDPIFSETGSYSYTYAELGTYTIELRAYGSDNRYIKLNRNIVVLGDDPVVIGDGYSTPSHYQGMKLLWNEEFSGSSLNTALWTHEIGTGCPNLCGWGNNELQYYRANNTMVEGGLLSIEARSENFDGSSYTSSRLISRDNFHFKYGRVDVRALMPKGQGMWPAIWMLGQNISQVGWPKCGEIDIIEMIGGMDREKRAHGTAHWDDNGHVDNSGKFDNQIGLFEEYHVYSIIWNSTEITWLLNDQVYHSFDIDTPERSEFHEEFFLILNVAVGGDWPGTPDATSQFPTSMKLDYIRVFQND